MTNPLSPERLVYGLVAAQEPVVSPDGDRIIFTRAESDPQSNSATSQLWMCDIDGGRARRLTWSGSINRGSRWSKDGVQIAFISNRNGDNGIYVLPVGGGDARLITQHNTAIDELAWSPDGTAIAYTTLVDPQAVTAERAVVRLTRRADYKHDARGYLENARLQVFVADVASGERRQLSEALLDHFAPQWSPDGRYIATQIHRRNGVNSQLVLIELATGETTAIGGEEGVVGLWAWSPSGDRILLAGDTAQTWQLDFFVYDVAANVTTRLTDDLRVLPQAGFPTIWAPPAQPVWLDHRTAIFSGIEGGASGLYEIDTETGTIARIHQWPAFHLGLSLDSSHQYVVQQTSSLEQTGEIHVFDRQNGSSTVITHLNDATFTESPPATWERFDIENEGFTIEAWLLKPPGYDPARQYPVVLDVHGGPQAFYGYGFRSVPELLATNGYLVVFANPRGSTSYGRDFAAGCITDWGGGDYRDLMAVVDVVERRPDVDANRIGIFGYSYGGFMTSWTITQTHRFKAAVCGAPVFDLESFYGTSDVGYVYGPMEWGGTPEERRDWCLSRSPSTFAHRTTTPTLIIHGEADDRCPIGQGEQMFTLLREAGCEVEFVRYPGGVHDMLGNGTPALRIDAHTRILEWFRVHL